MIAHCRSPRWVCCHFPKGRVIIWISGIRDNLLHLLNLALRDVQQKNVAHRLRDVKIYDIADWISRSPLHEEDYSAKSLANLPVLTTSLFPTTTRPVMEYCLNPTLKIVEILAEMVSESSK